MTTSFLLIVQIVLVVMITISVLLQKSSSIGLGAYSGSNESVFGAKGPASFLAKVTFTIGFLFVVNTIALGYLYSQEAQSSVVDDMITTTQVVAPLSAAPAAVVAEQNTTQELNTTK
ncbi:MAG: preprotein translocase subunit SecG [Sulfurimonas sp.]|jgi:preprotein translocase subunit SecG|nr:preprotein translocase subunit SecG [Sulfurimonas sp.]MBU1216674.1 preprotein translocase subunit SecG [bacterium]MBU1435277.1 preprotein translocase subunit SecG [bacterium]MBU1503136.1 preprotein translocase subunit SecG [bacterium]MBU3938535.1 preprotein translocase subunit SecG [bacterium]